MLVTRQLFWVGLGATAGVLVYRRASRAAEALRPENVAHSMASACLEAGYAMREFVVDIREGMDLRQQAYEETARERAALRAAPVPALLPGPRVASETASGETMARHDSGTA